MEEWKNGYSKRRCPVSLDLGSNNHKPREWMGTACAALCFQAHVALSAGLASFLQQLPRQQLHGMQECPGGLASYEVAVGDACRS